MCTPSTHRNPHLSLEEGDRKAYYETYENTKKTNDQLIKDMKDENNQLRKDIASLQRDMNTRGGLSPDQAEMAEEAKKVREIPCYGTVFNTQ